MLVQRASWHLNWPWRPLPPAEAPNVLIMTVDSLRADHVSLYGYAKATTPSIDRLFRQGAFAFRDCQAASTWTRPAVSAIVTGRVFPVWDEIQNYWNRFASLSSDRDTLLSRFHRAGYTTGWLSADPWASTTSGMVGDADHLVMPMHSHQNCPIALCQELFQDDS